MSLAHYLRELFLFKIFIEGLEKEGINEISKSAGDTESFWVVRCCADGEE